MALLDICTSPRSAQSPHYNNQPWSPLSTPHARAPIRSQGRRRAQARGDRELNMRILQRPQLLALTITAAAVVAIALCDLLYVDHNPHHPQAIHAQRLLDELPGHSQRQQSQEVRFFGGSPQSVPLFEETPQFFPATKFATIQAALTGNSSLLAPFGRSTGRVGTKTRTLTFNKDGIGRLKNELQYAEAAMLFEHMRLPDANAWILRLVASEACPGFQANLGVWGIHRDELLSNNAARDVFLDPVQHLVKIAPYVVHVLDVASPDMLGGEMWVWQPDGGWPSDNTPPAAVLPHHSNTLYSFRGDSYHGINGHNSTVPGPRISIELEQYKVPGHLYAQTVLWDVRAATTEFRAKRPPPPPQYQPSSPAQRAAAATLLKATQAGRRALAAVEEPGKLEKPGKASPIASPASADRSPALNTTTWGHSKAAITPTALTGPAAHPASNASAPLPALHSAAKQPVNATAESSAAGGDASQVQQPAAQKGANSKPRRSTTPFQKPPPGTLADDASGGDHQTHEDVADRASDHSTGSRWA